MIRVLARQLAGLLVTLFVSSFVVFGALYIAPGDPITFLTKGRAISPATVAALIAQYHLHDPLLVRYWDWLTGVLRGDFGQSIIFKDDVGALIGPRLSTTVLLVTYASLLIVVVGVVLGAVAGLRGGRLDAGITLTTTVGIAVPSFVVAIVLITVFAVGLGWFPTFGPGTGLLDQVYHLTLPAIALSLGGWAYVARVTRTAVRDVSGMEHVETARSRGLRERDVVTRHILRNALIPITTVTGITVASLIAGTVIVEPAFGLNGLGSLLVDAVGDHDFPVVQAVCLILVAAFVVVNVAVDVLYSMLDPRVRLGTTRQ